MPRNPFLIASVSVALLGGAATGFAATQEPTSAADLTTVSERSGFIRDRPLRRSHRAVRGVRRSATRRRALLRLRHHAGRPADEGAGGVAVAAAAAQAARDADLPVMLVQGGIHAGEIDGKDAGFLLLRELLEGKAGKGVLDKQVLLFVPVFNVDGHERFAAWNRPNQRGPEEMGWRTTAQNYNLNRDYVKADAPEMQAMLRLVERMGPAGDDGPARHRRRQVRARHLDHGRAAARAATNRCARSARPGATA